MSEVPGGLQRCEQGLRRALHAIAWLNLGIVLVTVTAVVLDKTGSRANTAATELSWWLYGVVFLFGLSLALLDDRHVRVDVLAQRFGSRTRRWIEIVGTCLLLLPLLVILVVKGWDYTAQAFRVDQGSSNPGGLPNYWLIKACIPLAMAVLFAAACLRLVQTIRGRPVGQHEVAAHPAATPDADEPTAADQA